MSDEISLAVSALQTGGVIAYPTETVHGLGVDPFNPVALKRLLALKGRNAGKGLILLLPDTAALARVAARINAPSRRLMQRFWPGPLTLLLPAAPHLSDRITGDLRGPEGAREVAVRISPHPIVTQLMAQWRRPLVSTSANPSGADLLTPAQMQAQWGAALAALIPGADHPQAPPSTIARADAQGVTILRQGALTHAELHQAIQG
ncbi:putative translation factor SUA5 [Magnetofaba australis IT-1]|uniref:L-threonylcarbamoyladenylate synthase n=2 Tax=Magnetofaba TaxID=1472292 RepID=A0A1Y2JYR0_9PROT|nr:putative translation factor SUA5 [Magnetofaba australis IT-1]